MSTALPEDLAELVGPVAEHEPGPAAEALADLHNKAVRAYGSDCGGYPPTTR